MIEASEELTRELEELKEDNALLRIQLRQIQEELEHYYVLYTSSSDVDDRARPVMDIDVDIEDERRARKEAEKVRDQILASTSWRLSAPLRWARLRPTGRNTDVVEIPRSELRSFDEEHRARLAAERQVEKLLNSTSWKVTAPIRWRPRQSGKKRRE